MSKKTMVKRRNNVIEVSARKRTKQMREALKRRVGQEDLREWR